MKKIVIILSIAILLISCSYAASATVEINDVSFKIPSKYQGGELKNDKYKLDNNFSIECIDDNIPNSIGLWAREKDFSQDLNIENHPVRHFCQYNKYVNGNHSHAYFASGNSIYEIAWVGEEITSDIEKLIKNTPSSKIDDDSFYNLLDESVDIYKKGKIEQDKLDAEYNYMEAMHQSQLRQKAEPDNTDLNRILLMYYNQN